MYLKERLEKAKNIKMSVRITPRGDNYTLDIDGKSVYPDEWKPTADAVEEWDWTDVVQFCSECGKHLGMERNHPGDAYHTREYTWAER